MAFSGRPLRERFGVELDAWDGQAGDLLAALERHHVVRVRNLEWDERRQLEITAAIGPVVGGSKRGARSVQPNVRLERGADRYADRWHADLSWSLTDAISVLLCTESGLDPDPTEFLDTSVGIDGISGDLMDRISGRTVLHDLRESRRLRPSGPPPSLAERCKDGIVRRVPRWGRHDSDQWASWPEGLPRELAVPRQEGRAGTPHPLVDRCDRTGTPFLRLGDHAWLISGLDAADSQDLLSKLHAAVDHPHTTWQQDWRVGDVIFYDNRMVLHRRVGVAGTPPGRVLRRTLAERPPSSSERS